MRRAVLMGAGLLASALCAASAMAQDAMSPQMKQALVQTCRGDLAAYCSASQPGDGSMKGCIKQNFRSFSDPCKAALRQAMANRQ